MRRLFAIILSCLVVASGPAFGRVVTFSWNAPSNGGEFPELTYEVSVNGHSFSNVASTFQQVDLPGIEGSQIDARVRAVGYPDHRIACCPPPGCLEDPPQQPTIACDSEWAEISTVWPADQKSVRAEKQNTGEVTTMPASIYGTAGKNISTANVSTLNVSLSVGGENRVLYAFVASGAGSPAVPSSVKWQGSSGTALTQLSSAQTVTGSGKFSVWRLIAPNVATDNVTVTWPSNQDETLVIAFAVQDADQTSPEGTVSTNSGSGTAASVVASSSAEQLVVGSLFFLDFNGASRTISQAENLLEKIDAAGYEGMAASYAVAAGTSTTLSYTLSGTIDGQWGAFGFSVNPASGGGAVPLSAEGSSSTSSIAGIDVTQALTAASVSASSGNGFISLSMPMQAISSSATLGQASLILTTNISASGLAQALASASPSVARLFGASAVTDANGQADLSLNPISFDAHVDSTSSGSTPLRLSLNFSSSALGNALATAAANNSVALSADGVASQDATGIFDSQVQALVANAQNSASGAAMMFLSIPIEANIMAQAQGGAGMTMQVTMAAEGLSNALASGTLADSSLPISADARGNAAAVALLTSIVGFGAAAANDSDATAGMSSVIAIGGQASNLSNALAALSFGEALRANPRYTARDLRRSYVALDKFSSNAA